MEGKDLMEKIKAYAASLTFDSNVLPAVGQGLYVHLFSAF
jgi:hypothetical protein